MKKISIIMMALALVMGMGQCKKAEQPANGNINGEKPIITVKFNNSSKLYFGPQTQGVIPVMWYPDDIVYVAVNGQCIGYLKATSTAAYPPHHPDHEYGYSTGLFSGYPSTFNIAALGEGDKMHFFTLGGVRQTPLNGDFHEGWGATQFTFSYADQSVQPAVLSHGVAVEGYDPNNPDANYHCDVFSNMNALVKFTVKSGATNKQITLKNVKNQATIKFTGEVVDSNETGDIITYINEFWNEPSSATRYACIPTNQGSMEGIVSTPGKPNAGTFKIKASASVNGVIPGEITLN